MHRSKRKLLRQKSVVKSKVPRTFADLSASLTSFWFCSVSRHRLHINRLKPERDEHQRYEEQAILDCHRGSRGLKNVLPLAWNLHLVLLPLFVPTCTGHPAATCYVLEQNKCADLPSCNNRNIDFGLIALWCYPGTLRFSSWARKSLVSRVLWY